MSHGNPTVPPGLPALRRGSHRDASHGVCLMELTAFLAGAPHSDAPACTHPVLAAVARVANDGVSDHARRRLALLAPDLIDTTDTSAPVTAAVVLAVCEPALAAATAAFRPRILRAVRTARRTMRRGSSSACTPRQLRSAAAAAATATAALALLAGDARDELLTTVVTDALAAYTSAAAATTTAPAARAPGSEGISRRRRSTVR
jgi:hypothetical protein